MNVRRIRSLFPLLAVAFGSVPAVAQSGATSIPALADRADAVAILKPLGSTVRDGIVTWDFAVIGTLDGTVPARISLSEPEGRACGRALHGLVPGTHHLAFLDHPDGASIRLEVSGAVALPRRTPILERFVRDVLATEPGSSERARLLADAVSGDAAVADPGAELVRSSALVALSLHPRLDAVTSSQWAELRRRARELPEVTPADLPNAARLLLRRGTTESLKVLAEFAGPDRPEPLRRLAKASLRRVGPEMLGLLRASLRPEEAAFLEREFATTDEDRAVLRFRSIRPGEVR